MVRYFTYIDEQTINSFYNQFDDSYDSEKKEISKGKFFAGDAKISLKNIILGLFDGEGQVTYRFQKNISEELERGIKIEKKIIRLIEIAKGNEKSKLIIELSNNKQLVCGTAQVIEINTFLEVVSKIYCKEIHSYEEFLNIRSINMNITWNEVKSSAFYDYRYGNGINIFNIINGWYEDENKMFSFVIIDNEYPIIMDMSYRKITMPHSELRSSGIFVQIKKFNVLGILTQISENFYIKPLALWNIVTDQEAEDNISYIYRHQ